MDVTNHETPKRKVQGIPWGYYTRNTLCTKEKTTKSKVVMAMGWVN